MTTMDALRKLRVLLAQMIIAAVLLPAAFASASTANDVVIELDDARRT